MSGFRRPAGPVRQLSLQTPSPHSGSATRRPLRRQRSEEPDLQVTSNSFRNENAARARPSTGHHVSSSSKPRQVKLAWTDRRSQNLPSQQVEVVARKYEGQQRPARPVILPEKDQVLYTRQQIAERLRRAWRERPNLDIFLNHCNNNEDQGNMSPASTVPTLAQKISPKSAVNTTDRRTESPPTLTVTECPPNDIESSPAGQDEDHSQQGLSHIAVELSPKSTPKSMNSNDNNSSNNIHESELTTPEPKNVPASVRRMQFKNSSGKCIMESFSNDNIMPETRPPLQRALSAPIRRQETISSNVGGGCEGEQEEEKTSEGRSSISRRRLKSAAPSRRKPRGREDDNTDEEKQRVGRRGVVRGEIVTMVSLMSPSESDNEQETLFTTISEPPRWFQIPKHEKPKITPALQNVVSENLTNRKIPKSVSFQKDPSPPRQSVTRQHSSIFPVRRESITSMPPMEREKRSTTVETPDDNAIKRRFIHPKNAISSKSSNEAGLSGDKNIECRSIEVSPVRHLRAVDCNENCEEVNSVQCSQDANAVENNERGEEKESTKVNKEVEEQEEPEKENIPEFKSAKERECWELYQKMCNKGLNVSYDTILRGMLTPTEYRLRHKALMSAFSTQT